jgi:hypothetical protein
MPGPTRRIDIANATIVSGGGGGGGDIVAALKIGPDFGESAGNDDNTFTTSTSPPSLDAVGLAGDVGTASAVALDEIGLAGDIGAASALSLPELGLAGDLGTSSSFYQANDANSSYANIDNLLYSVPAINLREDASGTASIASHGSGSFSGVDPFLIRPETVAGVTNDERNAYFKWDLTGIDGDFQSYALDFTFRVTNPSVLAATTITTSVRSSPSDPWSAAPYTWDNYEPVTTGTLEATDTESVAANSTEVITAQIARASGDSARNDWVYLRISSSLVGTLVEIETADDDNDPATVPHQAPYADLEIEFAP